jgi:hypothetical protein
VICAEAGNVFNEYLLISVFLDGLQPFAAHYIRSRVRDDMTIAQVQQEEKDAGLVGRAVAASSRSLALPRTSPIRLPLAPRPRDTVATVDSDSYASSESPAYEVYWTPNTHRVVATTECVPRDAQEGTWEGGSDVSIPIRVWTSYAGLGQEEPVLAISEHRSSYLCFSPDHFIGSCPQLTPEQRAIVQRNRATQMQNGEKAYGQTQRDCPIGNFQRPYVTKPMGPPSGQHDRASGHATGYSNPSGFSRHMDSPNRVYSDTRPPFRRAMWNAPPSGGDRRVEPTGASVNHIETFETPRGNDLAEHAPSAENSWRDA